MTDTARLPALEDAQPPREPVPPHVRNVASRIVCDAVLDEDGLWVAYDAVGLPNPEGIVNDTQYYWDLNALANGTTLGHLPRLNDKASAVLEQGAEEAGAVVNEYVRKDRAYAAALAARRGMRKIGGMGVTAAIGGGLLYKYGTHDVSYLLVGSGPGVIGTIWSAIDIRRNRTPAVKETDRQLQAVRDEILELVDPFLEDAPEPEPITRRQRLARRLGRTEDE